MAIRKNQRGMRVLHQMEMASELSDQWCKESPQQDKVACPLKPTGNRALLEGPKTGENRHKDQT